MDLHSCIIVLRDQKVVTSKSVEDSLGIIETQGAEQIETVQINATSDGVDIHTYHCANIEESLENLMNL
ncbi:hypothetical protein HGP28_03240 [Vibrio sp. SM6]|uniref:Uncharacterized protein n=1 Tax=Vibrio agarilyticus TaxID=2726741 RepID=A0A7X8YFQ2_9VIBR|nr:hypothetical protein [Vibrio agarilyticus]NLS11904.1 hypothetical protein [Vibrio agarilyticus]